MYKKVETVYHGRPLWMESGRMAKQADGAVVIGYGESMVLVTVVAEKKTREGVDFFPLTCDYQERTFAAGKIPGGFFKREGRPTEKETLTSRLIDRPIRPLFPDGFRSETQVIATVLSHDKENDPDVLAVTAASAALQVSDVPFLGPIGCVRLGRIDGAFVVNPTVSELDRSELNLIVAASREGIVMVEGGAKELPEDVILEALFLAQREIQGLLDLQDELQRAVGKPKRPVAPPQVDRELFALFEQEATPRMKAAFQVPTKQERAQAVRQAEEESIAILAARFPDRVAELKAFSEEVKSRVMRAAIVQEGRRVDGRGLEDIRPITCEVGLLPRAHGSALFTRGETQALVTTTLGTSSDEQKIDALIGEQFKKFMLHYNFPPFSVGEVRFLRSPGRREIGHGALAERAIQAVLPPEESFPYTIRVVSEILESNGSSSMATVCGATLALMDAGVPISAPVAGIAMGLIVEGGEVRILSDILGDEDHLGDMDFKVAGTARGITALQMDIKVGRVTREIMQAALYQAQRGRLKILEQMKEPISAPRPEVSQHAPRIVTLKIKPEKIREVIGPGGKVIRGIIEETGVKIDVEDDGTVIIASSDLKAMNRAIEIIQGITAEPEVGRVYKGIVRRIVDFGAFVEILPGVDGLLHISQIGPGRVAKVSDVLKEGEEILVKVLEIDKSGKIRLSRREAMKAGEEEAKADRPSAKGRSGSGEAS